MQESVKYRIVVQGIEEDIRSGKYAGRALPSEAQLVKRFGVGRKTVQRAILELQHLGLVVRQQGKGTFLTRQGKSATGLLGLLMPDSWHSPIFQSLSRELARIGQDAGYTFLFGEAAEGNVDSVAEQTCRFAREFASRRVEGVIFRPMVDERCIDANIEVADIIRSAGIPIVLIDSDILPSSKRSDFDVVGINNIVAGQSIAKHLIATGRRRIAFLMDASPLGISFNLRSRLFGLSGEIISSGGKWDKCNIYPVKADDVAGLKRLLRKKFRPDAIVCANDVVAVRLLHTLQSIGIRVPEDIAVMGCDDIEGGRVVSPTLSTIHQPVDKIAELAFGTLQRRIRGDDLPPCEIFVDAPVVVRKSTMGATEAANAGKKTRKSGRERKKS